MNTRQAEKAIKEVLRDFHVTGNGEIEWTLSFKGAVYGYTAIHKKEEGETV